MLSISSSSFFVYSFSPESFCSISSSSLIVSIVFLSLGHLPFHHLQFLSNLPQYSWSYLLFDHPKSFLAMNLPSNSHLSNIPSSHSCFAISSWSCQYSFSNSSIASFAFFKFSLSSQVFNSAMNPF